MKKQWINVKIIIMSGDNKEVVKKYSNEEITAQRNAGCFSFSIAVSCNEFVTSSRAFT